MLLIIQGDDEQTKVFKVFEDMNQDDFDEFLDAVSTRMYSEHLGWWDRSFSANSYDSWPTPGAGYTDHQDRLPWRDLPGAEVIESVLDLMEANGQRGRRFHIRGGAALLSQDDSVICKFLYYEN